MPGIYFFGHDLVEKEYFETMVQRKSPLMMSIYQPKDSNILQVIYASTQAVSIIQRAISSGSGEYAFEKYEDVHIIDDSKSLINSTDFIAVSKGSQYLIYKESSSESLGIIPVCTQNYYFENENFKCTPCQIGLRSYGLQTTECISCTQMWISRT